MSEHSEYNYDMNPYPNFGNIKPEVSNISDTT